MFDLGSTYTRKEIRSQIDGGMRSCLIQSRGGIVGVCYDAAMNPQAPRALLIGRGPQNERAGQALAVQAAPVPVFVKRRANAWEYLGAFKGAGYLSSPDEAALYAQDSGREDVAGVLLLAAV